jgi:uncharacterized heparinase superfamily protein
LRVSLYFHTLRYLKLKQLIFQVLKRIYKPSIRFIDYDPKVRLQDRSFKKSLNKKNSLIEPNIFEFFNERGDLNKISWNGEKKDKLWRYNQHYFDDLNSYDCELKKEWHLNLLERWIYENSYNSVGWEPYPTSLRIVNWIKWSFRFNNLNALCTKSLFNQGLMLEKNIEHHILGNHYFANAKALIFLGVYFDDTNSKRWILRGMQIASKELENQILPDGAHFELSPMYHCIFLEDVLDLINILKLSALKESRVLLGRLEEIIPKMIKWMVHMSFGDGQVSNFNDSANNVASNPQDIINYAIELGFESPFINLSGKLDYFLQESSGYVIVHKKNIKMILDVARLGPDNLLAHGHADTLAFEMATDDNRIFVNSGTSCYGLNDRREFERSTKAHNTVEINNMSSSETWASFRVGRRAYPYDLSLKKKNDNLVIKCSHDGYKRLSRHLSHTRMWTFNKNKISIKDTIKGEYQSGVSRFILHSGIKLNKISRKSFSLILEDSYQLRLNICIGNAKVVEWKHASEFGHLLNTSCIEVSLLDGISLIELI